jgi:pyrimidine-specific ribonucleoside hydrolase
MRIMPAAMVLTGYWLSFMHVCAADEAGDHTSVPRGERAFQILKTLPLDATAYQPPAAALVAEGIPEKFGHEEWACIVLTHEIHQHAGIYSILGAKMGVRARELLEAPTRTVVVTVETGARPPESCVIDGLQVALGSTLAQDLIHVPPAGRPKVAATFEYKGRKLRLSLKPEFEKKISEFIASAIRECGSLTPAYYENVEAFSYRVWAEFDRRTLFDEEMRSVSRP